MFIVRLYACLAALPFQKDVFMNYLSLYTCVQIVGESLPLSSSGNVKVWTTLCSMLGLITLPSVPFCKNIDFLLHIPTLLILLIFFFKRWIRYIPWYGCRWRQTVRVLLWVGLVDAMTSFFYFFRALHDYCEGTTLPLWIGFLITASLLYSTRRCTIQHLPELSVFSFKKAFVFGMMQSIAVIPGISRFASTYAVGRWYGYKPADALWFSFLIQIPLLLAAIALASYTTDISTLGFSTTTSTLCVIASLSAYELLVLVARTADRCTFWHFSWYALGLAALAFYLGL